MRNGSITVESFHYLRNQLIHIADKAVIRDVVNGCIGVAVDGNDNLRVHHPGEMLKGAGDSQSNIKFRRNNLARLAHLEFVWSDTARLPVPCGRSCEASS